MTLGARGAVIDGGNRVLLVRHTYAPGWHFPGGGIEPKEAALDALARELREEAAVELTGPPQLHGCFLKAEVSIRDHVFVYVVRDFRCVEWKRSREIADCQFFLPDRLPEDVDAGTAPSIAEITNAVPARDRW